MSLNKCIYTGSDDSSATFNSAEHIIPKCIGGIRCLPKGWVSDEVNNRFSALELSFARENPIVAINRMFGPSIGRKKHKNRDRIGVFIDQQNTSKLFLGYVKSATPLPLTQIIFTNLVEASVNDQLNIRIVIPPSPELTHEKLIADLFNSIRSYNGCPCCIKNNQIPKHSYLLGIQDHKWFLGISKTENPETIKPLIIRAVEKLSTYNVPQITNSCNNIKSSSTLVNANFDICLNYLDCFRVYAKIALNCLAFLKGQDYVLSEKFNDVKSSILYGDNVLKHVCIAKGENPVIHIFKRYSDKLPLGDQYHSVVFFNKDNFFYGMIALYGQNNPVMVKLSEKINNFDTDMYICDWQNKNDYKLIDCVLEICKHDNDNNF